MQNFNRKCPTMIKDNGYVKSVCSSKRSIEEKTYMRYMFEIGRQLIPTLLQRKKKNNKQRAKHVINLGLTNRMVHQLE